MEDSLEEGFLVRALVENEGLGEVVVAQDGVQGAALVQDGTFDLVICDLNLPGRDGVEVIAASKAEYPERAVIVTTGYSDPDVHERAIAIGADRVLTKPLDKNAFLEALWKLLAHGLDGPEGPSRSILAISPFPGDAEFGCGGVLAGLTREGCQAVILTLTSSVATGGVDLTEAATQAARHLGTKLLLGGLEQIDMARVAELVQDAVQHYGPDTVLLPSCKDRSAARLLAHEAALAGAGDTPHVYGYQTATSALEYRPNVFASIEKVMDRKVRALECFRTAGAPDHLDPGLADATARYWSRFSRHLAVEPLELIKSALPAAAADEARNEAA